MEKVRETESRLLLLFCLPGGKICDVRLKQILTLSQIKLVRGAVAQQKRIVKEMIKRSD